MISGSFKRMPMRPTKTKTTKPIPPIALADFIPRLTIEEPSHLGHGAPKILPFNLWEFQREVLPTIEHERRVICLKARQLGITWVVGVAYPLWRMIHEPNTVIMVISKGKPESQELIRRILGMYMRYQGPKPAIAPGENNKSLLGFENGSRVRAVTATKGAGRSFTGSILILDEYDYYINGLSSIVFDDAQPAVDAGNAQLFIISTANGEDGDLKVKWDATERGELDFTPIFLPWHVRPDRDEAWYQNKLRTTTSINTVYREYPSTPAEAFMPRTEERFIDMIHWNACADVVVPALDRNEPMVAAADGAVSGDCFAFVGVSRDPRNPANHIVRFVKVWKAAKGQQLDFRQIKLEIANVCMKFNIVTLVYDPYQLHGMMQELRQDGIVLTEEFGQQTKRTIADYALLQRILRRGIVYQANSFAVLTEHVDNANRAIDKKEKQLRIVKRSSAKKIDALVALSMASYQCAELPL